jgi:hypothetical protein
MATIREMASVCFHHWAHQVVEPPSRRQICSARYSVTKASGSPNVVLYGWRGVAAE